MTGNHEADALDPAVAVFLGLAQRVEPKIAAAVESSTASELVEARALIADLNEQLDRANAAAVRMARRGI